MVTIKKQEISASNHLCTHPTFNKLILELCVQLVIYFTTSRVQSIVIDVSVCLSTHLSQKPHIWISPNFLYMLPETMAQYSSDSNVIHYEFPVFWMTSRFQKSTNEYMSIELDVNAVSQSFHFHFIICYRQNDWWM